MDRLPVGYSIYAAAAIIGHASFVGYFHRYECHMYGTLYVQLFLVAFGGGILGMRTLYEQPLSEAIALTSAVLGSFLFGLFGSLLVWRIFLNPLNKFPGPWGARLGNLYMSYVFRNSDAYYKLQAMHNKYGKIVRIGSNDLSITDATIMEAANGRQSTVTKGWWYDNDYPLSSMHTTRSRDLHDKRRKVWAPAFSEKAMRDYETKVDGFSDMLLSKIEDKQGQPIDMRTWFNLFSFDIMALLAFGKNYGMLEKGEKHEALEMLDEGMQPLAYFFPTWFFRLLVAIPGLSQGYSRFVRFCVDELRGRVESQDEQDQKGGSDMMSWILRAYQSIKKPADDPMLQADARLIIVAGSDTTASAFSYMFYHLAADPEQVKKLRNELKPLTAGEWTDKDINNCEHLNGCIYEALRLHPPVPSGVQRLTPKEGMEADGKHIPGNTVFYMPQFVIGRDPDTYQDPDAFVPERWYSKPEMVKIKDAFAPFSMGPFGCIGKNLAMLELRTTTAKIVNRFDISFAKGEDGDRILHKTRDHFTVDPGSLDLCFKEIE